MGLLLGGRRRPACRFLRRGIRAFPGAGASPDWLSAPRGSQLLHPPRSRDIEDVDHAAASETLVRTLPLELFRSLVVGGDARTPAIRTGGRFRRSVGGLRIHLVLGRLMAHPGGDGRVVHPTPLVKVDEVFLLTRALSPPEFPRRLFEPRVVHLFSVLTSRRRRRGGSRGTRGFVDGAAPTQSGLSDGGLVPITGLLRILGRIRWDMGRARAVSSSSHGGEGKLGAFSTREGEELSGLLAKSAGREVKKGQIIDDR